MATYPRQGSVELGGYTWLARMLDKARLDAAGEIEAHDLEFPCPMDQGCLKRLGIDARTFQQIAVDNKTDESVLKALAEAGVAIR
jgi:Domain of unknown function (DUF5069)